MSTNGYSLASPARRVFVSTYTLDGNRKITSRSVGTQCVDIRELWESASSFQLPSYDERQSSDSNIVIWATTKVRGRVLKLDVSLELDGNWMLRTTWNLCHYTIWRNTVVYCDGHKGGTYCKIVVLKRHRGIAIPHAHAHAHAVKLLKQIHVRDSGIRHTVMQFVQSQSQPRSTRQGILVVLPQYDMLMRSCCKAVVTTYPMQCFLNCRYGWCDVAKCDAALVPNFTRQSVTVMWDAYVLISGWDHGTLYAVRGCRRPSLLKGNRKWNGVRIAWTQHSHDENHYKAIQTQMLDVESVGIKAIDK